MYPLPQAVQTLSSYKTSSAAVRDLLLLKGTLLCRCADACFLLNLSFPAEDLTSNLQPVAQNLAKGRPGTSVFRVAEGSSTGLPENNSDRFKRVLH